VSNRKCWCLQRQYIIQQLKENEADLDAADQELDLVNSEQNYDLYAFSPPLFEPERNALPHTRHAATHYHARYTRHDTRDIDR
jgi:hypothetical protein